MFDGASGAIWPLSPQGRCSPALDPLSHVDYGCPSLYQPQRPTLELTDSRRDGDGDPDPALSEVGASVPSAASGPAHSSACRARARPWAACRPGRRAAVSTARATAEGWRPDPRAPSAYRLLESPAQRRISGHSRARLGQASLHPFARARSPASLPARGAAPQPPGGQAARTSERELEGPRSTGVPETFTVQGDCCSL